MELSTAIRTRVSEPHLGEPAPTDPEFTRLLNCAAQAPDHGLLMPWRLITVRGSAREALAHTLAFDTAPDQRERALKMPMRAPLLAAIVFAPHPRHRIPVWEQMVSAACVVNNLMLLLHDRGYGSIWRTDRSVDSSTVRVMLDLAPTETLLGWLYVGTPDLRAARRKAARPAVDSHVSEFRPGRCLREERRTSRGAGSEEL